MPDHVVLPGAVHALEDQQHRVAPVRVQQLLQLGQPRDALRQVRERGLLAVEMPGLVGIGSSNEAAIAMADAEAVEVHPRSVGQDAISLDSAVRRA